MSVVGPGNSRTKTDLQVSCCIMTNLSGAMAQVVSYGAHATARSAYASATAGWQALARPYGDREASGNISAEKGGHS